MTGVGGMLRQHGRVKIITLALMTFAVLLLSACSKTSKLSIHYSNDKETITEQFPNLPPVVSCNWASGKLSSGRIGPTNYFIECVLVLDQEEMKKLDADYSWDDCSAPQVKYVDFSGAGDPESKWRYNAAFSYSAMAPFYVGEVYYDCKNGILYFYAGNG